MLIQYFAQSPLKWVDKQLRNIVTIQNYRNITNFKKNPSCHMWRIATRFDNAATDQNTLRTQEAREMGGISFGFTKSFSTCWRPTKSWYIIL